jgi:hypothetical protein
MMLDTRQVGLLLGCSPKTVRKRAQRLGVGQHDTSRRNHPWMFTRADAWDEDRWAECSNGIHFFLSRHEAEQWGL